MKAKILLLPVIMILAIISCDNSKKESHPCDKGCSYEVTAGGKDTVNVTHAGLKQGRWIERKMIIPKKSISPEDTKETLQNKIVSIKIAEGFYKDDKKEGVWKYYDEQDGSFKNSVIYKNGEIVN